jgi:hypothetical protein
MGFGLFWCAVFGQAYESAPNSQSAKDVTAMVDWLGGEEVPETIATLRFDSKVMCEATPQQRSIYRGAICLILASGARDFHTQAVITGKLINEEGIDDHHVFPAKFLESTGVTSARTRDCVLNRTLIDRTTNQIISARAPSPGPIPRACGDSGRRQTRAAPPMTSSMCGALSWDRTSVSIRCR